jgi:hypothetical protein
MGIWAGSVATAETISAQTHEGHDSPPGRLGVDVSFHAVVDGRVRVNTKGSDGLVYFAENRRIIQLSTGNATVYDSTGKAIGRNPGQVRFEFVVDHNGTPDFPDDILLSETLVEGSMGRSDDFCEVVVPALS